MPAQNWSEPDDREAPNIEAPEDFNTDVLGNLRNRRHGAASGDEAGFVVFEAPLKAPGFVLVNEAGNTIIEGTLSATGEDNGVDPATPAEITVNKAGWWFVTAKAQGQVTAGLGFTDWVFVEPTVTINAAMADRATLPLKPGQSTKYSLTGFALVECPLGTETITVASTALVAAGYSGASVAVKAWARYDKPSEA